MVEEEEAIFFLLSFKVVSSKVGSMIFERSIILAKKGEETLLIEDWFIKGSRALVLVVGGVGLVDLRETLVLLLLLLLLSVGCSCKERRFL